MKILYVEDDSYISVITTQLLEMHFLSVTQAIDGREALEKFLEDSFDCIVTDIDMPNMNGVEFIEEVRKFNTTVPIVILSSHREKTFEKEIGEFGVLGYFEKPMFYEEFKRFVGTIKDR